MSLTGSKLARVLIAGSGAIGLAIYLTNSHSLNAQEFVADIESITGAKVELIYPEPQPEPLKYHIDPPCVFDTILAPAVGPKEYGQYLQRIGKQKWSKLKK